MLISTRLQDFAANVLETCQGSSKYAQSYATAPRQRDMGIHFAKPTRKKSELHSMYCRSEGCATVGHQQNVTTLYFQSASGIHTPVGNPQHSYTGLDKGRKAYSRRTWKRFLQTKGQVGWPTLQFTNTSLEWLFESDPVLRHTFAPPPPPPK
jgi:hypothetical protein